MIPLMRYLELSQIHRDRMQNGCQLVGRLNGELLFNEHSFSFARQNRSGGSYTTM